jgi:hypothetical protein
VKIVLEVTPLGEYERGDEPLICLKIRHEHQTEFKVKMVNIELLKALCITEKDEVVLKFQNEFPNFRRR